MRFLKISPACTIFFALYILSAEISPYFLCRSLRISESARPKTGRAKEKTAHRFPVGTRKKDLSNNAFLQKGEAGAKAKQLPFGNCLQDSPCSDERALKFFILRCEARPRQAPRVRELPAPRRELQPRAPQGFQVLPVPRVRVPQVPRSPRASRPSRQTPR